MRPYQTWKYRGEITVTNPPANNGYLVYFNLFDWQPGFKKDFSDVRFADLAGNPLPVWAQTINAGNTASVWVQVPAARKFYYYFGNGRVSSVLGPATFSGLATGPYVLFADNLETGTADGAKWDLKQGTNGGEAGIKTDQKYNSYSIGVSQADGQGDGAEYDQVHALLKIPLSLIPVGTKIDIRHISRKNIDSGTTVGEFCGFGFGGNDSDSEIYNPAVTGWAFFDSEITRSDTNSWDIVIKKGGGTVATVSKTRVFDTYFTYGLQARQSTTAGLSQRMWMDDIHVRIRTATEPTLTISNSYPNPELISYVPQATGPDTESAATGLGMQAGTALKDILSITAAIQATPGQAHKDFLSTQAALQAAPGYGLIDQALSAAVTMQAAQEATTRDVQIIAAATALGMQVGTALKDILSITGTLQAAPGYSFIDQAIATGTQATLTPGQALKDFLSTQAALQAAPGYGLIDQALSAAVTMQAALEAVTRDAGGGTESAAVSMQARAAARVIDVVLMGLLDDMKTVIEEVTAVPVYTGWQPAAPDTCITLYEYAGRPPNTVIEVDTPGLQVRVRQATGATDYQAARTLANTIYNFLHDKSNFEVGGRRYIHITGQQSPFFLTRDGNGRPEFLINFLVKKDRS